MTDKLTRALRVSRLAKTQTGFKTTRKQGENSRDGKNSQRRTLQSPVRHPHQRAARRRASPGCVRTKTGNQQKKGSVCTPFTSTKLEVRCTAATARFLQHNCRAHKYSQGAFARTNLPFRKQPDRQVTSADGGGAGLHSPSPLGCDTVASPSASGLCAVSHRTDTQGQGQRESNRLRARELETFVHEGARRARLQSHTVY